ncbi:hypothetical protein HN385_02360 [archaeon]|jgi:hypothetical protein|nr:hypothetical protein [archaeon]MBT3450748.1 hypothetical protein [archaeon]MBT6868827.1 hypothetical protein [archaeon]MBT7192952.1 hypothetical protein [archaeon]MBT7380918.1 hypothetical protein [archaeon]
MASLIWDFNEFMTRNFKSLAMGLTPSGHIHLGFLSTLACAFMYLREHPHTHLTITNIENSLSSSVEKYNGVPLRFQYLEEGDLLIPKDYNQLISRNSAGRRVQGEITSLIWKLAAMFDETTEDEKRKIKKSFIPPKHKRFLELKENKVFHVFGTQIYVYSFMRMLEKDRAFRRKMIKNLTDFEFAKQVAPMCGIKPRWKRFASQVKIGTKIYQANCFQIPVRLYCPNCHQLCRDWAVMVFGHPYHHGPTLAAPCKNTRGNCPRALKTVGYDGYVYRNLKQELDMTEFHFMLDPMRDFYDPFKADCHIYGGDYFQLPNIKGITGAQKIKIMFDYLEEKTGQQKFLFGGPLITIKGEKMSKSGQAFNIKDIKNIKKAFKNIMKKLEKVRSETYPNGIQVEYTEIMKNVA